MIVEPLESLREDRRDPRVSLAVLSVPADAAQRVADLMVSCGIPGILNFAPVPLNVPPSVNVVGVDLSVQLEHLAYKVQNTPGDVSGPGIPFRRPVDRLNGGSPTSTQFITRW